MSNIAKAFDHGTAFIGFITGGDPDMDTSRQCILEMARAGADLIEVGIPFSDPIAEGPVVQYADLRALANGTTTDMVFDLVESIRKETDVPMVFVSYLNVVFKYGYEKFFSKCQQVGMDGVIIPDLPYEEKPEVDDVAVKYGVDVISMLAPTSDERSKMISESAKGYIYSMSSVEIMNEKSGFKTQSKDIVAEVKKSTNTPVAVCLDVNTPEYAAELAQYADGVIAESAVVEIVAEYGKDAPKYVYDYVKSMKDAIR